MTHLPHRLLIWSWIVSACWTSWNAASNVRRRVSDGQSLGAPLSKPILLTSSKSNVLSKKFAGELSGDREAARLIGDALGRLDHADRSPLMIAKRMHYDDSIPVRVEDERLCKALVRLITNCDLTPFLWAALINPEMHSTRLFQLTLHEPRIFSVD